MFNRLHWLPLLIVPLAFAVDAAAQPALTAADYARAEKFMGYNTNLLVYHAVHPAWTTGELLWYRDTGAGGSSFVPPMNRSRRSSYNRTLSRWPISRDGTV